MIKGSTAIYGIFGNPVSHSKSPLMHNAAFRYFGLDACYVAFDVLPERLDQATQAIRALNMRGVNITVPHKERIMPLLDYLSPEAEAIGAVNTVKNSQGLLYGYNTDAWGFIQSLSERGIYVKGKRILVLGAGGAARAVVYALAKEGAVLFIYNRTAQKAESLALEYGSMGSIISAVSQKDLEDLVSLGGIDMVINTTSLGLKAEDPLPCDIGSLNPNTIVCDLIYKRTPLLQAASEAGCTTTLDGSGMLLWQGVYAFQIWTGLTPPVELMREALR